MGVDQARRDQPVAGADYTGIAGSKPDADRGDDAILDQNVGPFPGATRQGDEPATQQQSLAYAHILLRRRADIGTTPIIADASALPPMAAWGTRSERSRARSP